MLAFILLGTLLGSAGVPGGMARRAPVAVSRAPGAAAAVSSSLSAALLRSLTPDQLAALHPRGRLVLRRSELNDPQRQLMERLVLALGAPAEEPEFSVRLVTATSGVPALALSATDASPADFLATRPLAMSCHW